MLVTLNCQRIQELFHLVIISFILVTLSVIQGDIVRRNKMLVTLNCQRIQELFHLVIISFILVTLMCDSRGYCKEK